MNAGDFCVDICLSNESGFQCERYFRALVDSGELRSFVIDVVNEFRSDVHVVLRDGADWTFKTVGGGSCVGLSAFQVCNREFGPESVRTLVEALHPLWAGLGFLDKRVHLGWSLSGSHVFVIPEFAAVSYWSDRYDRLFSMRIMGLRKHAWCKVRQVGDGFWVEIEHEDFNELVSRRRVLEEDLLPNGPWHGGTHGNHAVLESLREGISYGVAVERMGAWRLEHEAIALCSREVILDALKGEVKRRGKRRRDGDICSVWLDDKGAMLFTWTEQTVAYVEERLSDCVLGRRIKWAAMLHDFVRVPFRRGVKTHAKCIIYNSCMKEVSECDLEV